MTQLFTGYITHQVVSTYRIETGLDIFILNSLVKYLI